jgi:hypothetical protein
MTPTYIYQDRTCSGFGDSIQGDGRGGGSGCSEFGGYSGDSSHDAQRQLLYSGWFDLEARHTRARIFENQVYLTRIFDLITTGTLR